jgi:hypothetical protein
MIRSPGAAVSRVVTDRPAQTRTGDSARRTGDFSKPLSIAEIQKHNTQFWAAPRTATTTDTRSPDAAPAPRVAPQSIAHINAANKAFWEARR